MPDNSMYNICNGPFVIQAKFNIITPWRRHRIISKIATSTTRINMILFLVRLFLLRNVDFVLVIVITLIIVCVRVCLFGRFELEMRKVQKSNFIIQIIATNIIVTANYKFLSGNSQR